MITIKCDNCEKTIEAPDDQAGQKLKCPNCGDVNILPTKQAPKADRATAKGFPPATGPEKTVIKARPEMFRAKPTWFMTHVIVLLAGAGGAIYFGAISKNS